MAKNMFAARFQWLSALPLLIVIGALTVIAIGALSGAQSRNAHAREVLFDYFQRLKPAESTAASPFHIIEIDRESVEKVGPWPWPRTLLAELVSRSDVAGAKGVVLVEPVDAPDPLSPEVIGEFWLGGARDGELERQLSLLPSTDQTLAAALAPTAGAVSIRPILGDDMKPPLARTQIEEAEWLTVAGGVGGDIALPSARPRFDVDPSLRQSAALAVASLLEDPDGKVRVAPLLWSVNGRPSASAGLQAAMFDTAGGSVEATAYATAVSALGKTLRTVSVDGAEIPLGANATMRLYLPRRLETPSTPAWRIIDGAGSNNQLSGKVVLIGLDEELGGKIATPRGVFSAAEAHAFVGKQILSGATLNRPGWTGYVEALFVMIFGAAAIMLAQRLDFWKSIGFAALVSTVLLAASFASFAFGSLLVNPLPAALALFLGAFSVAGGRSLGVVLKDDSVRGAFQGSLPEPTMKVLREEGATELLDGAYRPVSILACELRLIDEDIKKLAPRPEDITNMIASACISLRKTIIETGGAAEQAEGGKIFAYFNAPQETADHVTAACSSALRLIESMDKINAEFEASQRTRGVSLHLAIGVATGECFVGPMGHGRSNRYSAIGPAVEMAAFLRRQAEFYGPAIICDETVHRKTNHHFAYLELDKLKRQGTDQSFNIFALVGNPFIKSSKSYRSLDETHRQLLAAYRKGDWAMARTLLKKAKESPGAKIALFDIYEERIRKYSEAGAPSDWDGAHLVTI